MYATSKEVITAGYPAIRHLHYGYLKMKKLLLSLVLVFASASASALNVVGSLGGGAVVDIYQVTCAPGSTALWAQLRADAPVALATLWASVSKPGSNGGWIYDMYPGDTAVSNTASTINTNYMTVNLLRVRKDAGVARNYTAFITCGDAKGNRYPTYVNSIQNQ